MGTAMTMEAPHQYILTINNYSWVKTHINHQLNIIDHQLTIIDHQLTIINHQLAILNE